MMAASQRSHRTAAPKQNHPRRNKREAGTAATSAIPQLTNSSMALLSMRELQPQLRADLLSAISDQIGAAHLWTRLASEVLRAHRRRGLRLLLALDHVPQR
jgi:hypothetical protein